MTEIAIWNTDNFPMILRKLALYGYGDAKVKVYKGKLQVKHDKFYKQFKLGEMVELPDDDEPKQ